MQRLFHILFLVLTPVALSYAAAPTSNVYEIEVVVFENRLPDLEGGELWTRDRVQSGDNEMKNAIVAGEIPPADSLLSAAATALESSGRHHVLAHLRWQQSAEARSVSQPVRIKSAESGLDGALRLYLSRFLLMDLDLSLREASSSGFFSGADNAELVYRLNEKRRIKLAETHYFDHPKFGVLVRVSPVAATN